MNNFKWLLIFFLFILSSCAAEKSNIDHLPREATCPTHYTFNRNFNQVWLATIQALAEEEIIKTINPDVGVVVTEFGTVDKRELIAIDTVFGARTYKYSYTINVRKKSPYKTDLDIKTNLKMSQIAIYEREQSVPWLESNLRKNLFMRICKQLNPNQAYRCASLFSKTGNAERSSPEPPVKPDLPVKQPSENHSVEQPSKNHSISPEKPKPNALILQVQEALRDKGYRPGPVDGLMGRKTRRAIKKFQKDTNIAVTGRADKNTLIALGLKNGELVTKETKPDKSAPAQSPDLKSGIQLASAAELMSAKDPFSSAIAHIPAGTLLSVKSISGEWYEVQYQGQHGFIHSSFIVDTGENVPEKNPIKKPEKSSPDKTKIDKKNGNTSTDPKNQKPVKDKPSEENNTDTEKTVIGKGKIIETTSLLSEPSFMANTIKEITAGQKLELLERNEEFYKVRYKGTEGYVYSDFVEKL